MVWGLIVPLIFGVFPEDSVWASAVAVLAGLGLSGGWYAVLDGCAQRRASRVFQDAMK
jgi:hypothetical protein